MVIYSLKFSLPGKDISSSNDQPFDFYKYLMQSLYPRPTTSNPIVPNNGTYCKRRTNGEYIRPPGTRGQPLSYGVLPKIIIGERVIYITQ